MSASSQGRSPERQVLDLIGLAARAGRVVSGTDPVRQKVRDGEVSLVILAADASPAQQGKLIPLMDARNVRYHRLSTREEIGAAIGRGPITAVGLADRNFAKRAAALIAESTAPRD